MGKTVVAVLAVAAIVAINFIPGVGQAITAGVVSAGLATAGTAAAAAIATSITTLVTSLALSALSMALAPTAKFNAPETSATPIKTSLPPRVSAYGRSRLYGAYVAFENTTYSVNSDTFAPYALDALAVHDGVIDGIEDRYLGDDKITIYPSGIYTGYVQKLSKGAYGEQTVRWYETLGATPGTANWAEFIAKLPGKWTVNHRGDGVAMIGLVWKPVSGDEFGQRFPQGAAAASIVGRWQKVFDWRDVTQAVNNPATWKWSENAVLHLAHYRLVREKARLAPGASIPSGAALQAAWDVFFAPTIAFWTAAANVCDENVALKAGGTEKRYRSLLAHKHTDTHKQVIDGLTQCFDGWTSPRHDGALVVFAGKYQAPTVSIGPNEIVSYSWQHGVIDEEAINELKITYVSAPHDYNPVDADAWVDTDDLTARGALRSQGIDFLVPSHSQARRLAKRLMSRVMAPNRGLITTNVAGRIVRGQRYINLKIEEAGSTFFDGVAEITNLVRNVSTGGVTFSWIEANPNIDAWNPATEEGDPAPLGSATTLVAPIAPVIDSAVLIFDASSDQGVGARVSIALSGPSGDDLIWFARWRNVGDPVWNEQRYSDVDSSAGVELVTDFVPVDASLEVEVAYQGGDGALSPWSSPATGVTTSTTTTVPDAAGAVTLLSWSDTISVSTPAIPRASSYRWRFYLSDGTTLKRTKTTSAPTCDYSKAEAHADGVARDYKVDVAGTNAAGTGTASAKLAISNPAPAAITGVTFADGVSNSAFALTASGAADLAGYRVAYSTTTGFNPMTAGQSIVIPAGSTSGFTAQLPAGSWFGKIAAFDLWTSQSDQLNYSAQDPFTISTGTGGSAGGGGGGGGGAGGGGGGGIEN